MAPRTSSKGSSLVLNAEVLTGNTSASSPFRPGSNRGSSFFATAPGGLPSLRQTRSSPLLRPQTSLGGGGGRAAEPLHHSEALDGATAVDASLWLSPAHATLWSPSQSASSVSCRMAGIPQPSTWVMGSAAAGKLTRENSENPSSAPQTPYAPKTLPETGHIPWSQLNPGVLPWSLDASRRKADRDRNREIETEEVILNDRLHSNGSLGSTACGGRASSPQHCASKEQLKQAWDLRRSFIPASLPREPSEAASGRKKQAEKILNPSSFDITKGSRLADLIESGAIGVVKSSYFEDCILHKRSIAIRQLIPAQMMWPAKEAIQQWKRYGKCFLIIVSYSWLTKEHPDPDQFHLKKLVRIIEEYKRLWSMQEVGVLLDYCSLWQRANNGVDTRTAEQRKQFELGCAEIVVAYGHKAVTCFQLTAVPPHVTRKYDMRGWHLLESIVTDSKGGDWNRWSFGDLDPESTQWPDPTVFFMQARPQFLRPPMTPKDFAEELETRRLSGDAEAPLFADPQDEKLVAQMYGDVFALLTNSTRLAYDHAGWGDPEVQQFMKVLPQCTRLVYLTLYNNKITIRGAQQVANIVPRFSRTLKILGLRGNPLCKDDKAMDLLHLVWSNEAKPLRNLVL